MTRHRHTTQDAPTAEPPKDERGFTLDRHGLPLCGPARLAALDGKPDPALAEPLDLDTPAPAEPAAPQQD